MLLIVGLTTKARRLGSVPLPCRVCGQIGLLLIRETTRFTVFFIPMLPVRTTRVAQCTNPACGASTDVPHAQARRLLVGRAGTTG
jgi:hypothetical protein